MQPDLWMPISKPPELSGEYLVCLQFREQEIAIGEYSAETGFWYIEQSYLPPYDVTSEVTHWMPLPALPLQGED